MKQILKTESVLSRLKQAVGSNEAVENLKVYEAIALNTRPLRKNHPLYREARADRSLLLELAAEIGKESRPILSEHRDASPLGRVFHGEVVDRGAESELRVLFFLDATANTEATKIDSGSIDQVSVSVVPKQIICSASGFDFLGSEATAMNVITGTDPDGNVLGEKGVYGRMVGLRQFFELSLVGMGGAQNARIVSRNQSHFGSSYEQLAASGLDPNVFVLEATTRTENMDLTELITQLTDTKAALSNKDSEITTLTAQIATANAKVEALEAQIADAGDPDAALVAKDEEIASVTEAKDTAEAELTAAVATLTDVAKAVLAAAGKPNEEVPSTVAEISALITETKTTLAAALVKGGRSVDVEDVERKPTPVNLSGFRVRK